MPSWVPPKQPWSSLSLWQRSRPRDCRGGCRLAREQRGGRGLRVFLAGQTLPPHRPLFFPLRAHSSLSPPHRPLDLPRRARQFLRSRGPPHASGMRRGMRNFPEGEDRRFPIAPLERSEEHSHRSSHGTDPPFPPFRNRGDLGTALY